MQEKSRAMYREHYVMVRWITPKERLLKYEMGDGWEPLCEFWGKPVPEVKFPRVNDQEHMKEFLAIVTKRSIRNVLITVGKSVVPIAAVEVDDAMRSVVALSIIHLKYSAIVPNLKEREDNVLWLLSTAGATDCELIIRISLEKIYGKRILVRWSER
jgi:Sulfotransferase domain